MRISDWSSDVCSSDLAALRPACSTVQRICFASLSFLPVVPNFSFHRTCAKSRLRPPQLHVGGLELFAQPHNPLIQPVGCCVACCRACPRHSTIMNALHLLRPHLLALFQQRRQFLLQFRAAFSRAPFPSRFGVAASWVSIITASHFSPFMFQKSARLRSTQTFCISHANPHIP